MNDGLDSHRTAYRQEANELLDELEEVLLELERFPEEKELIDKAFRVMHTVKGSGAMFGFDDIAYLTHEAESVFDQVRNGTLKATQELIDLTLKTRDCIRSMLEESRTGAADDEAQMDSIVSAFRRFLPAPEEPAPLDVKSRIGEVPGQTSQTTYRVRFRPSQDIFRTGTNPALLLRELQELGVCKIVAHVEAIPLLEDIEPVLCYMSWDIIVTTDRGIDAVKDVFIFVEDTSELTIDVIDQPSPETGTDEYKRLGEILIERGDVEKEEVEKILQEKKPFGALLVDAGIVSRDKVESALVEQEHVRSLREKRQKEESAASIKISADKLDKLVDLVGELVTVQAHLTQKVASTVDAGYLAIAEQVERLTTELRENAMGMRMLPIGTSFGRFKRLVRDLSIELEKEIDLMTEGAETELDKTVIEKLQDPLVHLIRNSIDHGIESPDVRILAGKPKKGTILLSAYHSGANVMVEIRDDGAGLDEELIRKKAIERGLISANADLSKKEIYNLILSPGFSTAKTVTNISGRGVGMDVVRRAIDDLRGSIDLVSEKGVGTTITIKLPLTLVIVEGLLVGVGHDHFVLPLSIVEECVELSREEAKKSHGRNLAAIRGEMVPYVRLREEFDIDGDVPKIEQIVVTGIAGERVGFVVDHVIGEHQTVIKNLGKYYKDVDGISGATILGDGSVALIVDVSRIVRNVELQEEAALR